MIPATVISTTPMVSKKPDLIFFSKVQNFGKVDRTIKTAKYNTDGKVKTRYQLSHFQPRQWFRKCIPRTGELPVFSRKIPEIHFADGRNVCLLSDAQPFSFGGTNQEAGGN